MFRVIPLIIILLSATPAASEVFIAQDGTGTYVGGLPDFITDGAHIKGTPSVDKNGFYFDGTFKKAQKKDVWKKIKAAIDSQLSSNTKDASQDYVTGK